jgi:hypothetical protein
MLFCVAAPRLAQLHALDVDTGDHLNRALTPRLLIGGAVAAVGLAYVQVASVPTHDAPRRDRTWDSVVREVRADLTATVAGLRRERDVRRATYVKMWNDTRVLKETLADPGAGH